MTNNRQLMNFNSAVSSMTGRKTLTPMVKARCSRLILLCLGLLLSTGCNRQSIDQDIKTQLALKAKTELNYAGLQYTVNAGTVTLGGRCPTPKAKSEVVRSVKDIAGVKQVVDQIQVAPLLIGTDYALKSAVDSVLAKHPLALAVVRDSVVTLTGQVEEKQLQNLLSGLSGLYPKQVHNQLQIRQEGR